MSLLRMGIACTIYILTVITHDVYVCEEKFLTLPVDSIIRRTQIVAKFIDQLYTKQQR